VANLVELSNQIGNQVAKIYPILKILCEYSSSVVLCFLNLGASSMLR